MTDSSNKNLPAGKENIPDPDDILAEVEAFATAHEGYQLLTDDPEKAASLINQAMEENPDSEMALNYKIQLLISQGKFDQAIRLAEQMIQSDPSSANYACLANVYTYYKKLEKAEENARKAIEIGPRNFHAHLLLAEILRKQKKHQEAIDALANLVWPSFKSEIIKSYCYMHLGEVQKSFDSFCLAEDLLEKKERGGPFMLRIRLYNGYIFLYSRIIEEEKEMPGLQEKAEQAASWLCQLDTEKIGKFQRQDFLAALSVAKSMTEKEKLNLTADQLNAIESLLDQESGKKVKNKSGHRPGKKSPEVIIRNNHRSAKAAGLDLKKLANTDPEKAIIEADKILEKNPENTDAYYVKTRSLMNLDRWEDAFSIAEEMIDVSQTDRSLSIGYTLLVQILHHLEIFDEAEETAEEAVNICGQYTNYYWLAIVLADRGKLDQAEQAAKKALEMKRIDKHLGIIAKIMYLKKEYDRAFEYLKMIRRPSIYNELLQSHCYIKINSLSNAFHILVRVENQIREENINPTGALIELYSAYIFIYTELFIKKERLIRGLLAKFKIAKRWLKELDNSRVAFSHRAHYLLALNQIRRHGKL